MNPGDVMVAPYGPPPRVRRFFGWRSLMESSAEVMRTCISVNDSPFGKRNVLGAR